jgi:hypothetical protein
VQAGCVECARALVAAGWDGKRPPPRVPREELDASRGDLAAVREGRTEHFRDVKGWVEERINRRYGEYRRTLLHEAAD